MVDKSGRIRYEQYGESIGSVSPDERLLAVPDELNREDATA